MLIVACLLNSLYLCIHLKKSTHCELLLLIFRILWVIWNPLVACTMCRQKTRIPEYAVQKAMAIAGNSTLRGWQLHLINLKNAPLKQFTTFKAHRHYIRLSFLHVDFFILCRQKRTHVRTQPSTASLALSY